MQDQNTPLSPEDKVAPELVESVAEAGSSQENPGTPPPVDTTPSLEEQLRAAELRAAEHHDAWLRARAEVENVRRRAQDDIGKASKFAAEKFATAMLPVKDSLEAALAIENGSLENLKEGVELTLKQLTAAFQSGNVAEENPIGTRFDPNKHQAISAIEADGEPNTVITVLQKGYLLNERVIRPALVVVSKAKTSA
ncbi:nucleotide exchange factor GrpE [Zoogloea sp.]|uniref:nucleotide exchange factor GrpE n=1 Tax=Zoogloea sp. TaxID=49181 RepID=UPI00262F09F8|nr:nucleotide exchange factor GrpE [Zoogloea sp.]MDD3353897.1 nucleotide exchange factor GrpE [Zoogloea sp.]